MVIQPNAMYRAIAGFRQMRRIALVLSGLSSLKLAPGESGNPQRRNGGKGTRRTTALVANA